MIKCKVFKDHLVYCIIFCFLISPAFAEKQVEMLVINAIVVNQACSLRDGDENIAVDFGNVTNKDLLRNDRTPGKHFQLHLDGCDTAISNGVSVTFTGRTALENSALLALDDDEGIAIGLEMNGQQLPFNKPSPVIPLTMGDNSLDFIAYVQLLPSGKNALTIGEFSAAAQFVLDYE